MQSLLGTLTSILINIHQSYLQLSGHLIDALNSIPIKEWLSPAIQIVVTLMSTLVIIWQVNSQNRANFQLQQETIKNDLERTLHSQIEEKLVKLSNAQLKASSYAHKIYSALQSKCSLSKMGVEFNIQEDCTKFAELNFKVSNCVNKLMLVIEQYEIIKPEIRIFITALNATVYDIYKPFNALHSEACKFIPIDIKYENVNQINFIKRPLPNIDELKKIERLAKNYNSVLLNIATVVYDLRIEIQNVLLGNLFKKKLNSREPGDPKYIVVKTDKKSLKKLKKYFYEKTSWGNSIKQAKLRKRPSYRSTGHYIQSKIKRMLRHSKLFYLRIFHICKLK